MCHAILTGWAHTVALCATSADWPEFRGQGASGIAPGKLPAQNGNLPPAQWFVPIEGQGWSSPVTRQDLLVLTAAIPDAEPAKNWKFMVLGLDPTTGRERFKTVVFERKADTLPKIHSKNSHASPTPVLTDKGIVAHFGHVGTCLVDNSGKIVRKKEGLHQKPVHGGGASPVVVSPSPSRLRPQLGNRSLASATQRQPSTPLFLLHRMPKPGKRWHQTSQRR